MAFDPSIPTTGLSLPSSSSSSSSTSSAPTAPLLAYLTSGQPESFFDRLYASEAAALGLFRLLPPVMRQVVMSTLWCPGPVKAWDLKVMLKMDPARTPQADLDARLTTLTDLHILSARSRKGITQHYLSPIFRLSLSNALTGGGVSEAFGVPYTDREGDGAVRVSVDELVRWGSGRWESMLKFMVSSSAGVFDASDRPNKAVSQLLVQSGLMSYSAGAEGRQSLKITSQGFQFLLEDREVQIWQMLMFYLRARRTSAGFDDIEDAVDVLSLYFSLGSMQLGRAYSTARMSDRRKTILNDLEDMGLVYKRSSPHGKKHQQFYPTRLATSLCSGGASAGARQDAGSGSGSGSGDKGFLILETNYKIYAYTSNELEIAILNLFIDILIRYPNLIVGKLERQNVKRAMEEGITADQIISYLTSHAHPQMHKNNPLLPITVVDQLHLWDKERHRLKTEDGNLFQFVNKDLFEVCADWARDSGVLLYQGTRIHPNTGFEGHIFIAGIAKDQMAAFISEKRRLGL